jgi:hypothetical protein
VKGLIEVLIRPGDGRLVALGLHVAVGVRRLPDRGRQQLHLQVRIGEHWHQTFGFPREWYQRVPTSELGCAALERLYNAGLDVCEVFGVLPDTALLGRGTWRQMTPNTARGVAKILRSLRRALEAVEAAQPFDVEFGAHAEDGEAFMRTWSYADFLTRWIPSYLDQCARTRSGVVAMGKPRDLGLRACAVRLDALVRQRTDRAADADVGAVLKAAFPDRFHREAAAEDDHAEAFRDLVRRGRRKR